MERDGRLHTAGLVLVPLMGHLLFVPHPGGAYFGDDMVDLAARLTPPRQARCLDLFAGPGTLSLRLATLAQSVVAVESSPVAAGCAELNLVMNGVADRVAVRVGGLGAVAAGERFGFVSAVPPVLPFPPALAGHPDRGDADDGLLPLRQVLELLPQALHPGGLAQVVALAPGDAEGPRVRDELSRHAEAHGLQIAVSVPAAARMRPGDRLFELMALRCAGLGGLAAEEARRRLLHHLAAARVDRVYRLFLSIQRGGPRPGLQVAPLYS
jgi:methylase of polypeptide subunit release factors